MVKLGVLSSGEEEIVGSSGSLYIAQLRERSG